MKQWTQQDDAAMFRYVREQFNGSPREDAPVPAFMHAALRRAYERAYEDTRRYRRLFFAALFGCGLWVLVAVTVGVLWMIE